MRLTLAEASAFLKRADKPPPLSLSECRDKPRQRGRRKYSNEIVTDADGTRFDSRAEHRRWHYLLLLQRAGQIRDLQRQVVFDLAPTVSIGGRKRPPLRYVADMQYVDNSTGKVIVEDVKGAVTPEFRIKRHLMASVHRIEIQEIRA